MVMSNQDSGNQHIPDVIEQFFNAYAKANVEDCIATFSQKNPIMVLGTNTDEVIKSRESLRQGLARDFSQMSNICWGSISHLSTIESEQLASVILELPIKFTCENEEQKTLLRYAFGLSKEQAEWKISQVLVSIPAKAVS
jgi:ketosteroid isomerase-like protein